MKVFKRTLLLFTFIIFMGIAKLLMEGKDYPNPYFVTLVVIALALLGDYFMVVASAVRFRASLILIKASA